MDDSRRKQKMDSHLKDERFFLKKCRDCGSKFRVDRGEMNFLNQLKSEGKIEKVYEPTRCDKCRKLKKQKK